MNNKKYIQMAFYSLFAIFLFVLGFVENKKQNNLLDDFCNDEITRLIFEYNGKSFQLAQNLSVSNFINVVRTIEKKGSKLAGSDDFMVHVQMFGVKRSYYLIVFKNRYENRFYVNLSSGRTTVPYAGFDADNYLDSFFDNIFQNCEKRMSSLLLEVIESGFCGIKDGAEGVKPVATALYMANNGYGEHWVERR